MFELGEVSATPSIMSELNKQEVLKFINRHHTGDWSDMSTDDQESNKQAVKFGNDRVFSAYKHPKGRIYVITEEDRNKTSVMFADEY